MKKAILQEFINYDQSKAVVESLDNFDLKGNSTGKSLYMKGIFIQGDKRNQNQRVYPAREIARAVKTLNDQLNGGYSVMGELEHPADLKINLDRVSHMIVEMWMEGTDGYGKLKILPTPMGKIIQVMLESGVKLGVSSRGSGNVKDDGSGEVSDFEIITVDIVAQPSAVAAYPTPIYEHLMNNKGGYSSLKLANELRNDKKAQKYLKEGLLNIINGLK